MFYYTTSDKLYHTVTQDISVDAVSKQQMWSLNFW